MQLFISIILWVAMGALCSYLAKKRGRDPLTWFFVGMLIGIFGILILLLMPPVESKGAQVEDDESIIAVDVTPIHELETKEWFYLDKNRTQVGPVKFGDLKNEWKGGNIINSTFIWSEGMIEWKKIDELDELKGLLGNFS